MQVYHAPAATDPDFPGHGHPGHGRCSRAKAAASTSGWSPEDQLAIDVSGGIGPSIDPLLFTVTVKPRPGADPDRIEKAIEEELDKIKKEGIAETELKKALNSMRMDFYQPAA